jgi:flagella basal body P-ring formation protein FlgA
MRVLTAILSTAIAFPADAATLRPATTLHSPVVLLRDLFDDPGAEADRVLGPGPAPGGRIVVEAPQLRAIARQFDVDWRPASSADRAVLVRPGLPMSRERAMDVVRSALVAAGASPDCDIELAAFAAPLIPPNIAARPVVSQLEYDSRGGRFSALLSVAGEGMDPVNLRVNGQVREMIDLPVAAASLPAGTILGPDDMHMARVGTASLRGDVVHTMDKAVGLQLARSVQAGQPIAPSDLTRPLMVRQGTLVRLRLVSAGLSVTGRAVALGSAAHGERVKVRNPGSKIELEGTVIGPELVQIEPGAQQGAVLNRGSTVFDQ